jgi:hypothetical protein
MSGNDVVTWRIVGAHGVPLTGGERRSPLREGGSLMNNFQRSAVSEKPQGRK